MAPQRHVNYILKPPVLDSAKPRGKTCALTDGGGLYVDVLPSGSKVWRFKYHLDGKREKVTIGAYPAINIKAARDKQEELRNALAAGKSPAKAKQEAKVARKVASERTVTFQAFAQRWVNETLFYRSEGYRSQIVRWLDSFVYPVVGDMQLEDVQPRDVQDHREPERDGRDR
jgi:hypothetical protein